jgi:hypothetical protein
VSDTLAELLLDLAETRSAALIFHGVVKQCGDGHFLVAAKFNDDRSDAEQMTDVRAVGALANLFRVQARGVAQSL